MTFAIMRSNRLSLETFSSAVGLHPDLVRRFVALGLLEPTSAVAGELSFDRSQLARAARIERLRTDLYLNYAAIGLVLDLLDRIDELEAVLRANRGTRGG
jgi:chaperone modulatory protein CbpM